MNWLIISKHLWGFTRVTVAIGSDGNFPEYQVKCYDFEPQAAYDIAEPSSNLAHSEQLSDANSL